MKPEALSCGLVSHICDDKQALYNKALSIAVAVAERSPVAVTGTKHLLLKTRDMSVTDGLDYTATWNAAMLQTSDIPAAIIATQTKQKPIFAKL